MNLLLLYMKKSRLAKNFPCRIFHLLFHSIAFRLVFQNHIMLPPLQTVLSLGAGKKAELAIVANGLRISSEGNLQQYIGYAVPGAFRGLKTSALSFRETDNAAPLIFLSSVYTGGMKSPIRTI